MFCLSGDCPIFVRMTTLTVKTEKAIKAVLDAFGLDYNVAQNADSAKRPLTKAEQAIYKRLKRSFEQIRLHQEGKIKLPTIEDVLAELS
jgi:hypothetical protein